MLLLIDFFPRTLFSLSSMLLCKTQTCLLLVIILILGIVIQLFSSSMVASCENKAGI